MFSWRGRPLRRLCSFGTVFALISVLCSIYTIIAKSFNGSVLERRSRALAVLPFNENDSFPRVSFSQATVREISVHDHASSLLLNRQERLLADSLYEIFPLQYYYIAKKTGQPPKTPIFKSKALPVLASQFEETVEEVFQHDYLQQLKVRYQIVPRADALPRLGLFLVESAVFRLIVYGPVENLTVNYASTKFDARASALFGTFLFTERLHNFVKEYAHQVIASDPHVDYKSVYMVITARVRVHLVCPSVERSTDALRLHKFRVMAVSVSTILSQPPSGTAAQPHNGGFGGGYPNHWHNGLNGPLHFFSQRWSPWTAVMLYGEKPLGDLPNPATLVERQAKTLMTEYKGLQSKSVEEPAYPDRLSFPCKDTDLFPPEESSETPRDISHCICFPDPLSPAQMALVYLGWYPLRSVTVYYRLIVVNGKWRKVHVIRKCKKSGWSSETIVRSYKAGKIAYTWCEDNRSRSRIAYNELLLGLTV